jgi:hypothetical protein
MAVLGQQELEQMVLVAVVAALRVMVEMPQEQLAELVDLAAVVVAATLLDLVATAATEYFTFSTREQL